MEQLFTYTPDRDMPVEIEPKVLSNSFADGYVQDIPSGVFNKPRTMSPRWSNMPYQPAKDLIEFLEGLKGAAKFMWAAPEEPVRIFKCPRVQYKWKNGRVCDISASFVEQAG